MNVIRDPDNPKTWMINTTVKLPDGSSAHMRKKGYRTKMDAVVDFEHAYSEFVERRGFKIARDSFNDLMERYFKYKSERVKPSTMAEVKGLANFHLIPLFNNKLIKNVYTLLSLEKFRQHVLDIKATQKHRNKILAWMRDLTEFAFIRGFITPEMYRLSKMHTESIRGQDNLPKSYTVWTKSQYRAFINTFKEDDKWRVLFQWMFFSGARIGETIALQWKDYDPIKKTVYIYKTASSRHGTGKTEIMTTKTKSGVRHVLLSDEMNQILSDLQFGCGQESEHYLFFGKVEPIGYTTVARVFAEHTAKAKLPRLKLHEIRHTNNTWLLDDHQSRAEADIITKRLGRSSLKVTLDTYYHSNPKVEADIVKKIKI